MKGRIIRLSMLCISALFVLASCAGLQPQVSVSPEQGEKIIKMTADSFKFTPNNIRASQGDIIVLKIDNVSGSTHNFTIQDPQEKILQSVDLPSQKTVEVTITLSQPGDYTFYCDKPLHTFFGMKGRIEAAGK